MNVHPATLSPTGGHHTGPMDMSDVVFALAAYQLSGLDQDLADRLGTLEQLTAIKSAYRERIVELQGLLEDMDGGSDWVEAHLTAKKDFEWSESSGQVEASSDGTFSTGCARVDVSHPGGAGTGVPGAESSSSAPEILVSRSEVETEIARLQSRMDTLSGEGEIGLLAINRLMSKRNQALQMASNVMSSMHQSAMGIISNIK